MPGTSGVVSKGHLVVERILRHGLLLGFEPPLQEEHVDRAGEVEGEAREGGGDLLRLGSLAVSSAREVSLP